MDVTAGEPNPNIPIEEAPTESPTTAGDTPDNGAETEATATVGGRRRRRKARRS